MNIHTVMGTSVLLKPILCTKPPNFTMPFYYVKVPAPVPVVPQPLRFTIDWSFKMRYCMCFYLNWHRNQEESNLNVCFLLSTLQYQIIMQQILINFLKKSNLHMLIPSCTFINFRNFWPKSFVFTNKKKVQPAYPYSILHVY